MAVPASMVDMLVQVVAVSAARDSQLAATTAERDALRSQLAAVASERNMLRGQLTNYSSEELRTLVATRDALLVQREAEIAAHDSQIAARDAARDLQIAAHGSQITAYGAQIAARDAALATARSEHATELAKASNEHAVELARASAERAVVLAAAGAERAAALAVAAAASDRDALRAERALTSSVLARDATLAAAIFERDDMRRKLARPSVRVTLLGEALLDAIGIVLAVGFAPDVSRCRELCRLTWRVVQRGDTASMLERSLELQCGAKAARAAKREDIANPTTREVISGTTQLIRAAMLNNLPRVLQLIQLGAKLDLVDKTWGCSALYWASLMGHEHVAKALLDGKYERRGATVDVCSEINSTPLMAACKNGREAVVRLLLFRGAKQELKDDNDRTALLVSVQHNQPSVIALLCAAPGAATALSLKNSDYRTPLALAIHLQFAACEAVLRAYGATV